MARSNYNITELRSGVEDQLLEQAVAWAASGESTPVPEPTTLAIFGLGLMGLASRRFRKN